MEKTSGKHQLLKHFIIGVIMGVAAQLIGGLNETALGKGSWDFSSLLGNIDLYPLIIVIMICSRKKPKEIMLNVFMYFLGLDIGYYSYTTAISIYSGIIAANKDMIIINVTEDMKDGAVYTFLGLLAGIWGYVMQKLRLKGKKLPYNLMLLPFLGLTAFLALANFLDGMLGMAIVDSISLVMIVIIYYRTRMRKNMTEEVLNG